jgi:hypothetical protein
MCTAETRSAAHASGTDVVAPAHPNAATEMTAHDAGGSSAHCVGRPAAHDMGCSAAHRVGRSAAHGMWGSAAPGVRCSTATTATASGWSCAGSIDQNGG